MEPVNERNIFRQPLNKRKKDPEIPNGREVNQAAQAVLLSPKSGASSATNCAHKTLPFDRITFSSLENMEEAANRLMDGCLNHQNDPIPLQDLSKKTESIALTIFEPFGRLSIACAVEDGLKASSLSVKVRLVLIHVVIQSLENYCGGENQKPLRDFLIRIADGFKAALTEIDSRKETMSAVELVYFACAYKRLSCQLNEVFPSYELPIYGPLDFKDYFRRLIHTLEVCINRFPLAQLDDDLQWNVLECFEEAIDTLEYILAGNKMSHEEFARESRFLLERGSAYVGQLESLLGCSEFYQSPIKQAGNKRIKVSYLASRFEDLNLTLQES